ncbi:cyclopropane mycolic acid synthase family methyltransferase [Mycolicibacterium rhodesiae]|uniref:SAM-dependent methyltransferase n=1 Tax=Mycolicibacterium rhodesiae TaxID=36814 RepID=A0A1X0IUZ5_MYCRH|nr:cyclopropane mycolic acid synthase family methyltransferase [Mycolicibacterium rhodesiae]ORB52274.1 SAM-dependent methyltransferase [Mycolicibacterium rhodesiae]
MTALETDFDLMQSIYDISDEFYALFLGPTMGYTCGYYEREGMTTDEAQIAKFDLALSKLRLEPGMTLLDVGCGWGAGMQRAIERYDVNVIGLTLSRTQRDAAEARLARIPTRRGFDVRLQGWEDFDEKVDRIVSIGSMEHYGHRKYGAFFEKTYDALPADGVMLLHTICGFHPYEMHRRGLPLTFEMCRFIKFIVTEIFPGGQLPSADLIEQHVANTGFTLTRTHSLQPHYVLTLEGWAANLAANRDRAVEVQSQEVYDRFMKYLTGCADLFRNGSIDINQFTLEK